MKWEKYDEGWAMPVKSWCADCEEGAVKQAANLAQHPALFHHVALMPDAHLGYGMPIGGVVAAEDAETVVAAMRETDEGRDAAVIGTVSDAYPGRLVMETAFGGKRILQKLTGAQLPRIC